MALGIIEDRPTPKEVYNFRTYLFALMASFGAMTFGYDSGVIGSTIALTSFKNDFGITGLSAAEANNISSNVVSVFQGGCFFGVLFTLPLSESYGRRIPLIITGIVFLIGSFMQTWANGNLNLMYVGRTLSGIGVGSASSLVPVYIAEFSPPAIRGRLVGMYEIMYQTGALIGFWINYGTSLHIPDTSSAQWRIPLGVQAIPGGLLVISMFIVWESPRFLAQQNRMEECVATLSRIRQLPPDHPYVQDEVSDMRAQLDREAEINNGASYWQLLRELFLPGNINRLGFGVGMMVFQNLSGINAINYYSPRIFSSLGIVGDNELLATGCYGIVKFVASVIFFVALLDRVGRRKALLVGAIGSSLAMWYIGAYIYKANPQPGGQRTAAGWVAIVAIYVFVIFYCGSWNGIAWLICSEVFSARTRTLGVTITTLTQWLMQFIIAKATPYMISDMGYGTYFFFASWMIVGFLWVLFLLPETKGVRLEDMDILFGIPGGKAGNYGKRIQSEWDEAGAKGVVQMKENAPV